MLAFLNNLGPIELVVVAIVAILVFGKNLPEAAAKAVVQIRKFRSAVDDLKRDTGIEKEIRDIERTVREAEWEARRPAPAATLPRRSSASAPAAPAAPEPEIAAETAAGAEAQDVKSEGAEPGRDRAPGEPPEERRRSGLA